MPIKLVCVVIGFHDDDRKSRDQRWSRRNLTVIRAQTGLNIFEYFRICSTPHRQMENYWLNQFSSWKVRNFGSRLSCVQSRWWMMRIFFSAKFHSKFEVIATFSNEKPRKTLPKCFFRSQPSRNSFSYFNGFLSKLIFRVAFHSS